MKKNRIRFSKVITTGCGDGTSLTDEMGEKKEINCFFGKLDRVGKFWVSWHGWAVVRKSRTIQLILQGSSNTQLITIEEKDQKIIRSL